MHLFGLVAFVMVSSFAEQASYEGKINEAKERFYQKRYEEAERFVLEARSIDPADPESYELRTTIILFRLKQTTGINGDRQGDAKTTKETLATCPVCPELLRQFENDSAEGIRLAQQILVTRSDDERALFLLAKMNLNKLWLNLQVLDRRKGWQEYREARKLLGRVLEQNPQHARALTASAWINYIVGGRNFLVRAVLGGGSRKTALKQLRQAVSCVDCDFFDRTEAKFSLLDILRQEKCFAEASALAEELRIRFPQNAAFIHVGQTTVP